MPWNESRPRLNLVLITIECWRADHFGARTPMLAKFGEESAVFAEAQAAGGWTLPSMTALMSSTHASMHGGCFVGLRTPVRKPLAEYLLEEGYWTAGFSSNPTCGSRNGFHRGFADYQNVVSSPPDLPDEAYPHRKDWRQLARMGIRPSATERTATAAQMTDLGLSWIEARDPNAPWFLWLHYTDSHWPYWAPDDSANPAELFELWRDRDLFRTEIHPSRGRYAANEGARTRWLSRYGAALQAIDCEVGRLLDGIRARTDWDRTMVVATGDHGEEFYEHGLWQHQWNRLFREGVHVPLIVRAPGSAPRKIAEPAGHVDIVPTFFDYAGLAPGHEIAGASLRPLIAGGERAAAPVISEMMAYPKGASYILAIREGEWKYVYDFEDRQNSKLFHVNNDPFERENLREQCSDKFRRFDRLRLAHVERGLIRMLGSANKAERFENSDEIAREQLAALGYL